MQIKLHTQEKVEPTYTTFYGNRSISIMHMNGNTVYLNKEEAQDLANQIIAWINKGKISP